MDIEKIKKWWPVGLVLLVGSVIAALTAIVGGIDKVVDWIDPSNGSTVENCSGRINHFAIVVEGQEDRIVSRDAEFVEFDRFDWRTDEKQIIDCLDRNDGRIVYFDLMVNENWPQFIASKPGAESRIMSCYNDAYLNNVISMLPNDGSHVLALTETHCKKFLQFFGGTWEAGSAGAGLSWSSVDGFFLVRKTRAGHRGVFDMFSLTETDVPLEIRQNM